MKTKYIRVLLVVALAASMSFTAIPTTVAVTRPTIKIGGLGPLAITPGRDMKKGMELAIKEINEGDGVNVDGVAHDFEAKIMTTSGADGLPDVPTASAGWSYLVNQEQVVAGIGGFRTEVVLGGIQSLLDYPGRTGGTGFQVPFLGVGSTTGIYSPYYWRVGPGNGSFLLGNLIGFYLDLLSNYGIMNVTIAREEAAWTAAYPGVLSFALGAYSGGKIKLFTDLIPAIPQDASGSDINTLLDKVDQNGTMQAILHVFSAPVGKTFTEQWAAKGLNKKLMLAGINVEAQRVDHYENTQGAAAGEIALENAPPGIFPTVNTSKFVDAFKAEYNGEIPTYTSYSSYDSVYIIRNAIQRAKAFDALSIQAELVNTDMIGTSARMKFTTEPVNPQVNGTVPITGYSDLEGYDVHDLYTTSSPFVAGDPYPQVYYAQWLENGTKLGVYPNASSHLMNPVELPPYTSEFVLETSEPGITTVITSGGTVVTTVIPSETITETEEGALYGFGFILSILASAFILSVNRIHRRKRI
ncbi:MAG: ABC transporter substrate-binding protein [Candidatus Kariarchaeaceae archaeon]|jgi:ABC-type branched-subunit amino acid transport system substrate-binding protein